jgi:hypothetical protein
MLATITAADLTPRGSVRRASGFVLTGNSESKLRQDVMLYLNIRETGCWLSPKFPKFGVASGKACLVKNLGRALL